MTSGTSKTLQALEASADLMELERALFREQTGLLCELRSLNSSEELRRLSEKFASQLTPNILEIVEEFGRLDPNDEHLHSRFLELFLRPNESRHGLSDKFLKALLKVGRFSRGGTLIQGLDFGGDLTDTEVIREAISEQGRADLKLRNERQRFVLLIENKVLSGEGNRQLARYWEDAEREDPGFAIAGLFLTPDGRQPTTAGKYDYVSTSYGDIAELLANCIERGHSGDARVALVGQYAAAIRRWFVEDPEKKKLAWRIYNKFPAAAAYLSTDGAKPLWQIFEHLQGLVKKSDSSLEIIYGSSKTRELELWFVPREWDKIQQLRHAGTADQEKQADDRLLIFWFYCVPESEHEYERQLNLYLGAVRGAGADEVRNLIGGITRGVPSSSRGIVIHDQPQVQWTHIWARRFLDEKQLGELDRDVVFKEIDEAWQQFLDSELPKIKATIVALFQKPRTQSSV